MRRIRSSVRCSARAECWTAKPVTRTIRPKIRVLGRVGKQIIKDTGPLTCKRMETAEEELLAHPLDFIAVGQSQHAVLSLAQYYADACLDPPFAQVGEQERLRSVRGRP